MRGVPRRAGYAPGMSPHHAAARNPWRCPYCGETRTIQARPGHLRASEACRALHSTIPDYRASVEFTHLPLEEQAATWADSDVGKPMAAPPTGPGDEQVRTWPATGAPQQPEPTDDAPGTQPATEPERIEPDRDSEQRPKWGGFLAE